MELEQMLRSAADEIRSLRRVNDVLQAKVDTMELMATFLHSRPADRIMRGEGEDIAWRLDQYRADMPKPEDFAEVEGAE